MFKEVIDSVYLHVPSACRPVLQKCYYVLNPTVSWRNRKRSLDATREFAIRFFGSEEQLEAYEAEFDESCVGPAIGEAIQELPDSASLYDAHKEECARLYALVRERQPDTIVETGVYHGVSTVSILAALEANGAGRLYSVDYSDALRDDDALDPVVEQNFARGRPSCAEEGTHVVPAEKDPGWIVPEHLCERWEYIPGKPRSELPDLLARLGDIDLFHHDSSHATSNMRAEFELAWQHLNPGGMLVSNHVGWNDVFETFADGRSSDYGLMTWHYNPDRDYPCPGRSGYVVKPAGDAAANGHPRANGGDATHGRARSLIAPDSRSRSKDQT